MLESLLKSQKCEQKEGHLECPHCLCKPCITSECFRQMWWETDSVEPDEKNHSLRKEKYKYFWTMLYHREVFLDERYINRKLEALKRDPRRRNTVYHRREILPDCVLNTVRKWYPNPPDIPYMGHRWN